MKYIILILSMLLLLGCARPVAPNSGESEQIVKQIRYIKDRHGICYAAVNSYSYGLNKIVSIATVPCEKVDL